MSNDHLSDDRNPDAKHLVADAYKDGVYYFPGGVEITDAEAARIHPPIDDRFVELLAKHARILDELGDHLYDHLPDHHKDKGIAVQEAKAPYDKAHLESGAEGDVVYPDDVVALIEDYYEDTSSIDEMDPAVKRLGDEYIMALGEVEQALSHEYEFLLKGPKDSADRKIARIVGDRKFSALLGSIAAAGREVPIDAVSLEDAQESPSEEEHLSLIESEFEAMVADPQPPNVGVTAASPEATPTTATLEPGSNEATHEGESFTDRSAAAGIPLKPAPIGDMLTPGVLGVVTTANCLAGASFYAFKPPAGAGALRNAIRSHLGDGTISLVPGTEGDPVYGFNRLADEGGLDSLGDLQKAGLSGDIHPNWKRPTPGQRNPVFFSMSDPILLSHYQWQPTAIQDGDGVPDQSSPEGRRQPAAGGNAGGHMSDGQKAAAAANTALNAGSAAAAPFSALGGLAARAVGSVIRAPGDAIKGIREQRYAQRVDGLYEASTALRGATAHALSLPEGSSQRVEALKAVEQTAVDLGSKHRAVADGIASVVGNKHLLEKASDALAISRKRVEDTRDDLTKARETETAERIAQLIERIMAVLMKLLRGFSGKYSPPLLAKTSRMGEAAGDGTPSPAAPSPEQPSATVTVSPTADEVHAAPTEAAPRSSGLRMS